MTNLIEWLSMMGATIATKATETVTSEFLKQWLGGKKRDDARKSLLDLYKELKLLEEASMNFAESLDLFVLRENSRNRNNPSFSDTRWYGSWRRQFDKLAVGVVTAMISVSEAFQELNPKAEIYFPEVTAFIRRYSDIVDSELAVPLLFHSPEDPAVGVMNIYTTQQTRDSEIYSLVSYDEIQEIAIRIKQSVEELSRRKRLLADFIKNEFKYSDF